MLDAKLLDILVCPQCKGELRYDEPASVLVCERCRFRFAVRDGIPILLIDEAERF